MNKFMDLDLIDSLGAIVRQNTGFYRSDFESDKKIFKKAVSELKDSDKTFLWLSRPCGTDCYRECEVFLKDSPSYSAWQFFGTRNHNGVLAYVVEITGNEGSRTRGNLYELDFRQHCKHVEDNALPIDYVRAVYEHGSRKQPVTQSISGEDDPLLGKFLYSECRTNDTDAQRHILWEEKRNRDRLKQGDFQKYLVSLQTGRIETEAKQIVHKIRTLGKPNSPDGEYFMAELSPVFTALASNEDLEKLYLMMPYTKYSFSEVKGKHGIYVLVAKGQSRNKNIRKNTDRKKEIK